MSEGWLHTIYKRGVWVNEMEGVGVISSHWSKAEAVVAGRRTARSRRIDHVIHMIDGTIELHSGHDERLPPLG
jgi:hypothetical protein